MKSEAPPAAQNESEPPADYLENDPRFKGLVQQASVDYLRTTDKKYLSAEGYSGAVSPDGKLIDAEGKETAPSILVGPAGWGEVQKNARAQFEQEFGADLAAYDAREKTRVYDDPSLDPAYKNTETEISRRTNQDAEVRNASTLPGESAANTVSRIRAREEMNGWSRFARENPEKAQAYAPKNERLQKELELRQRQKEESERAQSRTEQAPSSGALEKRMTQDEARIAEVRESLRPKNSSTEGSKKEESKEGPKARTSPDFERPRPEADPSGKARRFEMRGKERVFTDPHNDPDIILLQERLKVLERQKNAEMKASKEFGVAFHKDKVETSAAMWKEFIDQYPEKAREYQKTFEEIKDILAEETKKPRSERSRASRSAGSGERSTNPGERGATQEKMTPEEIIRDFLSYQDASFSEERKKALFEHGMKNERSHIYAEALGTLLSRVPEEQLEALAKHMVNEAQNILGRIGLKGSAYVESRAWAFWDIAKQYHYATHPDEMQPGYKIADPLKSPEKVQEIIDRHVGWEAYHAKDKAFMKNIQLQRNPFYNEIRALLAKAPKTPNGDLSSKDLAELGSMLRKASA